jgi:hypothetical protein
MRAKTPKVTRSTDGAVMHGSDFVGAVTNQGTTTFSVGKSAMLSPAYFVGTFLGNMVRSYEKYRWRKLRIVYVPSVSTSVGGQVLLCSSHSVSEPCLNSASGTFLQRAMSQGNASMGPPWIENYIDIDCSSDWKLIDPATTNDPDDCIAEELQVYTTASTIGRIGYLYAEYEIEFKNTMYQPHSTSLPIFTGPGLRINTEDTLAVNAVGDDWNLTEVGSQLNLTTLPPGTVFRAVFNLLGSTEAPGTSWTNFLDLGIITRSTATASSSNTTSIEVVGGMTVYFVVVNQRIIVCATLEAATNGGTNGQFFVRTATVNKGFYMWDVALIRYGPGTLITSQ